MTSLRDLHSLRCSLRWVPISAIIILSIAIVPQLYGGREKAPSLHLAGDKWFLSALTKTGTLAAFEQKTGIPVEVVFNNDDAIMSDLDRGASDEKKALDIIVVRHRLLGSLVQKQQVRPIDAFLVDPRLHDPNFLPEQQFFTGWWGELSSYGEHIYGYPFTGLTTFLCYRRDLLENSANQRDYQSRYHRQLTVPRTWQEYNEVAAFFTRPESGFYGTYIQGKQSLALWYEWLNLAYSFGGNILDSKNPWDYGDIVVNSPQNVAATTEYMKLIAFSPPDTLNFGWDQAQSSLQQGKVFMGLLWSDQAQFLEDPKVSKVAGKIGYAMIPSNSGQPFSQLEGLTYLIPTESKHPQEAYEFLEFAMSETAQVALTLNGGNSLRNSTYADPRVQAISYSPAFQSAIGVAKGKPTIPESPKITDAMVRRLSEIVRGRSTPKDGLDEMALDLNNTLGTKSRLRYAVQINQGALSPN